MPGSWEGMNAEGVGEFADWEQPSHVQDQDFAPDEAKTETAPESVKPEPKRGRGRPRKESGTAPRNTVNVKVGAPGKAPVKKTLSKIEEDKAKVEAKAKDLAQMISAVLMIANQGEDAMAFINGGDNWASAVGNLAEYEPWLVKLCAGGDSSGRAMAWVQFAIATGMIALPIAMNHNAVPESMAKILSNVTTMAGVPGVD